MQRRGSAREKWKDSRERKGHLALEVDKAGHRTAISRAEQDTFQK
jgi:hypothetical protein